MRPQLLAIALPIAALSACASVPPAELPPLTRLAQHEVECSAELSREGIHPSSEQLILVAPALAVPEAIHLSTRVAVLEPDAARRLVGWQAEDGAAWSTELSQVEQLFEVCLEDPGVVLREPARAYLLPGDPIQMRTLDQVAYVKGFDFELREGVLTADPIVGTFTEGVTVTARAEPTEDLERIALELDLELVHLCRPIPVYETNPLGGRQPLSIQQPVASAQPLIAAVELGPEECLVIVRPALDGTDRLLFLFLVARPAAGNDTHAAG